MKNVDPKMLFEFYRTEIRMGDDMNRHGWRLWWRINIAKVVYFWLCHDYEPTDVAAYVRGQNQFFAEELTLWTDGLAWC